jgi:hypothetical protein
MAYPLFTRVSLKEDFPEYGLYEGDLATIVEKHDGEPGQETGSIRWKFLMQLVKLSPYWSLKNPKLMRSKKMKFFMFEGLKKSQLFERDFSFYHLKRLGSLS